MNIDIDGIHTLLIAIVVLFIGVFLNRQVAILRNYNIPEPVVGGIVFAIFTSVLHGAFDINLSFDMALRGPLMLAFFTTVGLIASFKLLVKGGPRVLLFLALASVFLIHCSCFYHGFFTNSPLHDFRRQMDGERRHDSTREHIRQG